MKLAVIGSRGYTDLESLVEILDVFWENDPSLEIISGGATGADAFVQAWAECNKVPCTVIRANWAEYGKAAGYIRNGEIWDLAEAGVAFWDGESKGTAHSFKLAKKRGKTLVVINYVTGKLEEI